MIQIRKEQERRHSKEYVSTVYKSDIRDLLQGAPEDVEITINDRRFTFKDLDDFLEHADKAEPPIEIRVTQGERYPLDSAQLTIRGTESHYFWELATWSGAHKNTYHGTYVEEFFDRSVDLLRRRRRLVRWFVRPFALGVIAYFSTLIVVASFHLESAIVEKIQYTWTATPIAFVIAAAACWARPWIRPFINKDAGPMGFFERNFDAIVITAAFTVFGALISLTLSFFELNSATPS